MPLAKTRTHLVDVSRKLFARVGYEHTTMNDIAMASGKGRRTLYTYFKSKDELYWAVVESELDILTEMMRRVAVRNIDPDKKIIEMIFTRLDAVKEVVYRNGTLRANFFRDIWAVEKVRKKFDSREIELFEQVLREGVNKGFFNINDTRMTATLVHYCVKGIEVPHIRGQIAPSIDINKRKQVVADMVLGALHRPEVNNEHFIEEQLLAQQLKEEENK